MKKVNNVCKASESKLFKATGEKNKKQNLFTIKSCRGSVGFFCRVVIPLGALTLNFLPTGSNGRCNFLLAHKQTMDSTQVRLKILQCHLQRSRGGHQS